MSRTDFSYTTITHNESDYNNAVAEGHTAFIDTMAVTDKCKEIYTALIKAMPNLIPIGVYRKSYAFRHSNVFTGVVLASNEAPDTPVGVVGGFPETDGKYYVRSRLIQNNKFAAWNKEDYQTKESKDLKKVLKIAKETLLPTQFYEMFNSSEAKFMTSLAEIRRDAVNNLSHVVNRITPEKLREELLHMHEVGYKPKTDAFAQAIEKMLEIDKSYVEDHNYRPDYSFVWIKKNEVMYKSSTTPDIMSVKTADELPENIRNKMCVLMITDGGFFIRDLGMKQGETYWVIE